MAKGSQVDFLVVGAGVAGLRAAVELARHGEVLVVTKESVGESNTHYAQGGIAVAMEGDEDIALHLEDTVNAGDGLVYRPAAEALVSEGPLRVAELIEWGANFDRNTDLDELRPGGQPFLRTREGAHSLPRILHANGDATGAEISRSLAAFARVHKRIRLPSGRGFPRWSLPMAAWSPPIWPAQSFPRPSFPQPRRAAEAVSTFKPTCERVCELARVLS